MTVRPYRGRRKWWILESVMGSERKWRSRRRHGIEARRALPVNTAEKDWPPLDRSTARPLPPSRAPNSKIYKFPPFLHKLCIFSGLIRTINPIQKHMSDVVKIVWIPPEYGDTHLWDEVCIPFGNCCYNLV
ncbi:hypothetical protein SLA2020_401850 [Shorea laevis]